MAIQFPEGAPKQNRHYGGSKSKTNRDVSKDGYIRKRVFDHDKRPAPYERTEQERKIGTDTFTQDSPLRSR
jgi:hypothetical protein